MLKLEELVEQLRDFQTLTKTEYYSKWPQRQDSLNAQLLDLKVIATILGMYDAGDYIEFKFKGEKQ